MAEADIPGLAEFLSFDSMKNNPAMNKQSFVDVSEGSNDRSPAYFLSKSRCYLLSNKMSPA